MDSVSLFIWEYLCFHIWKMVFLYVGFFFSLSTLNMSFHCIMASISCFIFLNRKSAVNLIVVSLYLMYCLLVSWFLFLSFNNGL